VCFAGGCDDDDPKGLGVAEFAAAVGVGADTIHFYEKTGLLLAPARTPAGYRAYAASAVDRLQLMWMTSRFKSGQHQAVSPRPPKEKILHWRSKARHPSDGAWRRSRIAAIARPDVSGGRPPDHVV
jgi:hypothetical protein